VLLLHGWDPLRRDDPFWFTIGGAAEKDETLPAAAVRELREEVGIVVDEALLGEPVEVSYVEFTWAGMRFEQDQTFYAVLMPSEASAVSFDGQEALERSTIDKHGWLLPEDLERGETSRPADPRLPDVMRLAIAAVLVG
jgi:8-oxo-dGTP pyrophosphatase MutT (NUDIX family)